MSRRRPRTSRLCIDTITRPENFGQEGTFCRPLGRLGLEIAAHCTARRMKTQRWPGPGPEHRRCTRLPSTRACVTPLTHCRSNLRDNHRTRSGRDTADTCWPRTPCSPPFPPGLGTCQTGSSGNRRTHNLSASCIDWEREPHWASHSSRQTRVRPVGCASRELRQPDIAAAFQAHTAAGSALGDTSLFRTLRTGHLAQRMWGIARQPGIRE